MSGMWSPTKQELCCRLILFFLNAIFNIVCNFFLFLPNKKKKKKKVLPVTWVLTVLL